MNVQLDTNILTRLAQTSHPLHARALAAVQQIHAAGHTPCILPQNLFEYWVVATRPVGENGLGLGIDEAKAELDKLKTVFVLLLEPPGLLGEWEKLIVCHTCSGKQGHDARIVAAMNVLGINHLLTFNVRDFARFAAITVLDAASHGTTSAQSTN